MLEQYKPQVQLRCHTVFVMHILHFSNIYTFMTRHIYFKLHNITEVNLSNYTNIAEVNFSIDNLTSVIFVYKAHH